MVHYATCKNKPFTSTLPHQPSHPRAKRAMAAASAAHWKPARQPECASCRAQGHARHWRGRMSKAAICVACSFIRSTTCAGCRPAAPRWPAACSAAGFRPARAATARPTFSPEQEQRSGRFRRDSRDGPAWPARKRESAHGLQEPRHPRQHSSHRSRPYRAGRR